MLNEAQAKTLRHTIMHKSAPDKQEHLKALEESLARDEMISAEVKELYFTQFQKSVNSVSKAEGRETDASGQMNAPNALGF